MKEYSESQIREILTNPEGRDWSIQGFGMLRLWLNPEGTARLHIWDTEQAYDNPPSTVHTHPWDFRSRIVFGNLTNQRYVVTPNGVPFNWAEIRTGTGGSLISDAQSVKLATSFPECYGPEDTYSQDADEIHESYPQPGAVTVIYRDFKYNRHAKVFWSANAEWATAEPRTATPEEVRHFLGLVRLP